jgi:hypothetical protein
MNTAIQIILAGGLTGSLLFIFALARSGYGRPPRNASQASEHRPEERDEPEARMTVEV